MKAFKKIYNILEILKDNKNMRLSDIADRLKLSISTAHRLISILMEYGFIYKDKRDKRYNLGYKFLDYSNNIIENMDVRDIALEGMQRLNNFSKETIHLALLIGDTVVYTEKIESQHAIRMHSRIGGIAPLYCTGVGKAILAFQNENRKKKLINKIDFKKYTKHTITDKKSLLEELDRICDNGYSLDNEEHEENIICLAVPIRDASKIVIGSISITSITYRLSLKELLEYKNILIEECKNISKKLGFRENG